MKVTKQTLDRKGKKGKYRCEVCEEERIHRMAMARHMLTHMNFVPLSEME